MFFLLFAPCVALAQPVNTELSTTVLHSGEPFLAVNPANPENLVVAWMSLRVSGLSLTVTISTRASFDGGAQWEPAVDLPHNGSKWQSADVSMAWATDGTLYLDYIDYLDSSNSQGGVFVVHSTDGGRSFSEPVKAIDAAEDTDVSLDRPWLAVDNSGTATQGNLYLPTKPAPWNPVPNHSYFTRSTDGGATWQHETVLDSTPFSASLIQQPMGSPAVGANGTLYIAYPCADSKAGYALATSTDGGASFTRSFILQPGVDLREKDSIKGAFQLVADPKNADHLVFFWPDARLGDLDIFASASFDRGQTWSSPVRVNDDPAGNGVVQDMLWPTFGASGKLAVVWRDRRNGGSGGDASATDSYFATSTDGGLTWSRNVRVTNASAPFNKILVNPGNDFQSAAIASDTLYMTWADMRTDSLRIYFAKAPLAAPSDVSITTIDREPAMTVVPNPGAQFAELHFVVSSSGEARVAWYDARGALVRAPWEVEVTPGMNSFPISLADLAEGSYTIVVRTSEATTQANLVVRR